MQPTPISAVFCCRTPTDIHASSCSLAPDALLADTPAWPVLAVQAGCPHPALLTPLTWDWTSSNHTGIAGAKEHPDPDPQAKGICRSGCCCQMTHTPSTPGSLPQPWHHLWPCVSYRWLSEGPYGCHATHLSYCLLKAVIYEVLSDPITVWTTAPAHALKLRHLLLIQNEI